LEGNDGCCWLLLMAVLEAGRSFGDGENTRKAEMGHFFFKERKKN